MKKINDILDENKVLMKNIESLKAKLSGGVIDEIISAKEDINGISVICAKAPDLDTNALRDMGDKIKDKEPSSVILLISAVNGKVNLVAMATDDAVKKGANAGLIVKSAASACGGGGGGKPNMAQAGGKDPSKISEALNSAFETIKNQIG